MSGRRADTSLAALLLTQRLVDNPAPPFKAAEFWTFVDVVGDLGRLLGMDVVEMTAVGLTTTTANVVAQRLDSATALAFELETLEQSGVRVLSGLDPEYPARLRDRLGTGAPPVLHVTGSIEVLGGGGLGVVGSRSADSNAIGIAREAAKLAVKQHQSVISGAARGIDEVAMTAALDAGGVMLGVLADSLVRRLRDSETRRALLDGRACLCTPYRPSAGFSVANAMGRNRIVYALSDITFVVIAEDGSGGTWSGALEALRRQHGDVVVWTGPGCGIGNQALVGRGAKAISDLSRLFDLELIQHHGRSHRQLSLGLGADSSPEPL